MENLVVYQNQFNDVALKAFTANQLNLLLSIASKVRECGTSEVEFSFKELKKIVNLNYNYSDELLIKEIVLVNKKLLSLNFTFIDKKRIIQFALFTIFEIIPDLEKLIVSVNEKFSFLLNNLTSDFTQFELEEFVSFKSSYTKEFFRRMKQFKNIGLWVISIEDFRRLLDIPNSYQMADLDRRVFAPILNELKDKYQLKIIKKNNDKNPKNPKGGRPKITHFEFRFLKNKKDDEAVVNKSENYLRLHDEKIGKYANFEIVHTAYNDDGKIVLKLKSTKSDTTITQIFNHINHYTNFLMKFSV